MSYKDVLRKTGFGIACVLFIIFITSTWTPARAQNASTASTASAPSVSQPAVLPPNVDAQSLARYERWEERQRMRQASTEPGPFSSFRLSDLGVLLTIITVVGGTIHRYLLRSIKKELGDFQLNLFTMLDQRYVSISANQLHMQNDQREHDQLRRDIGGIAAHCTRLEEAMLLNDRTRPRVL